MSCVAIIGLGNPGSRYSKTRHNLGFWFLDNLAKSHGITFQSKSKFNSDISKFTHNDRSYMLVKPLTFMNQSGKYLRSLLSSNSCDVDKSILVHDELTLQVGQMKISTGKSAGGHNGVKSIFDTLGMRIMDDGTFKATYSFIYLLPVYTIFIFFKFFTFLILIK